MMFAGPIIPGHPSMVGLKMMRWLYPSHCRLDLTQFVQVGLSSPHLILRRLHVKHPVFVRFRNFALDAWLLAATDEEDGSTLVDPGEEGTGRSSASIRATRSQRDGGSATVVDNQISDPDLPFQIHKSTPLTSGIRTPHMREAELGQHRKRHFIDGPSKECVAALNTNECNKSRRETTHKITVVRLRDGVESCRPCSGRELGMPNRY
jgi:hypothetical protein